MKGTIETITAASWDDLNSLGCDEWLWIDASDGVHLAATLGDEPAQVTHVWGWAADRAVRVRVDVDLPHDEGETGLAGAVLRWGDAVADPDLALVEGTHRVWKAGGGRAHLALTAGLHEPDAAGVTLRTLTCQITTEWAGQTASHTATFLRR